MEEAPNKRNALVSLTNDAIVEILRRRPACSLFSYNYVCHSWNCLISDPNIYKVLPQTLADFYYDSENDNRHFTSVTGECPSLEFLPFTMDNVAILDCCNGLILC